MLTKIKKSILYCNIRQYFPMQKPQIVDDRSRMEDANPVLVEWPAHIRKPKVGVVQDPGNFPRWTKYCRFLDNNFFQYGFYDIHAHDWIEKAEQFDAIVGIPSNELFRLEEMQEKYHFLETHLHKLCYPSAQHAALYEDKKLEVFLAKIYQFPYVDTYISYDKTDALRLADDLPYPLVSKISPSSGSIGVELIHNKARARQIIHQAFSNNGRITHVVYSRQKNYVYFQKFLPNDGYDIRVIMVGNRAFGYYRRAPENDFRASGMHIEEKRSLPEDALFIARRIYQVLKSPQLVVDMLHGLDGNYYINEFSPICHQETPRQLMVDGVPGAYVFEDDKNFHFEPCKLWTHELALQEFFLNHYIPRVSPD